MAAGAKWAEHALLQLSFLLVWLDYTIIRIRFGAESAPIYSIFGMQSSHAIKSLCSGHCFPEMKMTSIKAPDSFSDLYA